jgi:hypothetical protein
MKVSGFWSLAGLVVTGLIVADLILHPTGTAAAGKAITGVTTPVGNQLIGTAA